jgi:hypothetical protein
MNAQTLASAFQAALAHNPPNRITKEITTRDGMLLAALERSVTNLDQIVQRRLGLMGDAVETTNFKGP